ncbi:MAG: metallophosphoesterase [Pirellulaceae bacterium]
MKLRISFTFGMLLVMLPSLAVADDRADADAFYKAEKWAQARELYQRLLPSLSGDAAGEVLRHIGYTLQRENKHAEAIAVFEQALKIEGLAAEQRSGALLRLGYSLRMEQRGREGIAVLEKAAEVEDAPATHVAEALLYAAWEYNTQGEVDAALARFRRIESIPDVHANYIATAQLNIGRLLQNRGEYREAIEAYRAIADLNPVASTNRARARVYALECEALLAGDTPFHIKPYVSKVSTNSARLYWVSQGDAPVGSVSITRAGESRRYTPTISSLKDTICHLHATEIAGLQAGAEYQYEVDCAGEKQAGSFKTAPASAEPLTFCVIGDTQSYHPALQPLLDALGEEPSDFVLHVGDITDRGNLWGEWKASFFDPGAPYLRKSTFWPAYGNHDGGPYFGSLFELQDHYWYSFDYANVHVVVLDSYGAGSGGKGRLAQLKWLEEDLAKNDKPWTFVALHVPMVATRRSMKWFGDEDFLPLLEKHEVDIVFSGHHPHYRRYVPIGQTGKQPILHITTGGGGGPVGGYMPSPLLAQGINVNHYTKVRIDGDRLELSAHAISGAVIDRFVLSKETTPADSPLAGAAVESNTARKVISLYQELLTDTSYELHLFTEKEPAAGETSTLTFDLAKLPRGPLDPGQFGDGDELIIESTSDSAWRIPRQTIKLGEGRARLEARPPKSVAVSADSVTPAAEVALRLSSAKGKFEPVTARARILLTRP